MHPRLAIARARPPRRSSQCGSRTAQEAPRSGSPSPPTSPSSRPSCRTSLTANTAMARRLLSGSVRMSSTPETQLADTWLRVLLRDTPSHCELERTMRHMRSTCAASPPWRLLDLLPRNTRGCPPRAGAVSRSDPCFSLELSVCQRRRRLYKYE